jgi:hypothetical protein
VAEMPEKDERKEDGVSVPGGAISPFGQAR